MNLGQLKKKVQREFAKSPAKTVVLIALCPVALYFIAPLFLGGKPKVNEAQTAKLSTNESQSTATDEPANASPLAAPDHDWKQLTRLMEADERRRPRTIALGSRNPFKSLVPKQSDDKTDEDKLPETNRYTAITEDVFASLGLRLTSTLAGTSSSATINGRRYKLNEAVVLEGTDQHSLEYRFVLSEIKPGQVTLQYGGDQFKLELVKKRARPGSRISIVRSTPAPE